jgi:hypothetical protein
MPELLDYFPVDSDGYTFPAYMQGIPGLHNAVRFSFRPTPMEERGVIMDVFRSLGEGRSCQYLAELLAAKIVSWNLTTVGPEKVRVAMPISKDAILRLRPAIWIRMVSIVIWGTDGGDIDPDLETSEQLSEAEQQIRAIIDKARPVDHKVDEELKN